MASLTVGDLMKVLQHCNEDTEITVEVGGNEYVYGVLHTVDNIGFDNGMGLLISCETEFGDEEEESAGVVWGEDGLYDEDSE